MKAMTKMMIKLKGAMQSSSPIKALHQPKYDLLRFKMSMVAFLFESQSATD